MIPPQEVWLLLLEGHSPNQRYAQKRSLVCGGWWLFHWFVEDRWVPRAVNFMPQIIVEPGVDNGRVKDFFMAQGFWDIPKLLTLFSLLDVQLISQIQLPIIPRPDRWAWLPSQSGVFSARSAYLTANKDRFTSPTNIPKAIWLKIWDHKLILPRHKLLWWQMLSNSLPLRDKLNSIFPVDNISCPLCNLHPENALHLLFFLVMFPSTYGWLPRGILGLRCWLVTPFWMASVSCGS